MLLWDGIIAQHYVYKVCRNQNVYNKSGNNLIGVAETIPGREGVSGFLWSFSTQKVKTSIVCVLSNNFRRVKVTVIIGFDILRVSIIKRPKEYWNIFDELKKFDDCDSDVNGNENPISEQEWIKHYVALLGPKN